MIIIGLLLCVPTSFEAKKRKNNFLIIELVHIKFEFGPAIA